MMPTRCASPSKPRELCGKCAAIGFIGAWRHEPPTSVALPMARSLPLAPRHLSRISPKDDNQEEAAATATQEVTADDARKKMNLPQFLHFKKSLKGDLQLALKGFQSPMKGRTYAQYLTEMVGRDKNLEADPEIQQLDVPAQAGKVVKLHQELRDVTDKTVTLWRYSMCREAGFVDVVKGILAKRDEFRESIEELKQLAEIVQEVKLGLRRQTSAKRRQENHKVTKLGKAFVAGSFSEDFARIFSRRMSHILEGQNLPEPVKDFDGSDPHVLVHLHPDCKWDLFDHMQRYLSINEKAIEQDTLKLVAQMQTTSIMKPVAHERPPQGVETLKLKVPITEESMRPWLLISNSYSNTWGPLRWPLVGVPGLIMSLDTWVLSAIVSVETLISKGLGVESQDWWSGEQSLNESDVSLFPLKPKEGLNLPFGYAVVWAYVPTVMATTREGRKMTGKIIFQWALHNEVKAPQQAKNEVKHSIGRLFAAHGSAKPWSTCRAPVEEWLKSLGE